MTYDDPKDKIGTDPSHDWIVTVTALLVLGLIAVLALLTGLFA